MKKAGASGSGGGIAVLLHTLDEAYEKNAWHGTTLKGSLKGVTASQAVWRPARGRHNILELALHAAYWKYRVRRRLVGGERGAFPIPGNNWFERSGADEKAWRAEKKILETEHRLLREAVARFPAARLTKPLSRRGQRTAQREIAGIALHDVYHTGQIQLLKALQKTGRG